MHCGRLHATSSRHGTRIRQRHGTTAPVTRGDRAPVAFLAGRGHWVFNLCFLETHLHCGTKVKAWEINEVLQGYLADTLRQFEQQAKERGIELDVTLQRSDFIKDAVFNLASGKGPRFTHAVLNPPDKKINQRSEHRLLLRKVGIETVNLYTAFVVLSILLMEIHGEIVAIIPRSFCDRTYYRPFRELLLKKCAIKHLHLFESRKKAFRDDEVLQENIIIHLVRSAATGRQWKWRRDND